MSSMNLGDGTAGGYNSIYGNNTSGGYYDIYNSSGIDNLPAENNYWGGGALTNKGGANSVTATPYLTQDPNK